MVKFATKAHYLRTMYVPATRFPMHSSQYRLYSQIDVRTPSDVAAGLAFSNKTGVPLIVKNTGHDYIGRSSAPKSLALWTKNLVEQKFDENFVPVGCSKGVGRALSNGAGVTWIDAYKCEFGPSTLLFLSLTFLLS